MTVLSKITHLLRTGESALDASVSKLANRLSTMLARLRIGPKLLLAPAIVLLLLIVLSCGAYYAMVRQNQSLEVIVQQRAAHLRDTAALVASAHQAHTEMYQLLTWISASFSRARVDALAADIHQRHAAIKQRFASLAGLSAAGSAERRFIAQAASAHATYVKAILDVIELSQADHSTSASAMSKAEREFEVVSARLGQLSRLEQELSEQASNAAAADFHAISILMPLVIALSIVLSLAVTMAVRRALLREITGIGEAAVGLANGNLMVGARKYGNDEIADTSRVLDTSIRNLNATLKGILASARSIDTASREMAIGNADLSSRTEAQASSLLQAACTMEQMTTVISQTASNAQAANRLAENASSVALRGSGTVERLVALMTSIRSSSSKVVDITTLIDSIASQTGVLALNAAVEAAHAGQHGAGFAVAASQVRMLARQTATAARAIRELIAQAVADIDGGSASVLEAGHSMTDLATSVQKVGDIISAISYASAEQASGIFEVSQAIVQMDQMTQKNSALVTDAAAAAERLQRQAAGLARAVAGFNLDEAALLPLAPLRHRASGRKNHLRLASRRA
ncbi:methyl-accepting chemotaxis protein [Massilia psychrophila]|nr:methyl-accepting chemotaxis protein [Massilia psychrophila]GGE74056.1 methyl-accepting chemotaxis protein [Massilia psychrophila]